MGINKTLKSVESNNKYITLTKWNFEKMFDTGHAKYIVDVMDEKTGDVETKEFSNETQAIKYFEDITKEVTK